MFATATESQCSLMKPASVTISRRRSNCEYLWRTRKEKEKERMYKRECIKEGERISEKVPKREREKERKKGGSHQKNMFLLKRVEREREREEKGEGMKVYLVKKGLGLHVIRASGHIMYPVRKKGLSKRERRRRVTVWSMM